MNLRPEKLVDQLDQELLPCYLICGDEPMLVLEAADQVRAAARSNGFDERQVFHVDARFDWDQLVAEAQAMSLFASRRVLDVRAPTGKLGREGSDAIRAIAETTGDHNILLLSTGKLDRRTLSGAWASAISRCGAVVQCWPIRAQELPAWLDGRMRQRGLIPDAEAARILAERVEGNLLAAVQEIDKLRLLHGEGPVSAEVVRELVADSARFELFALIDEALAGRGARALRMAGGLRREDTPVALVGVMLSREVRRVGQLRHLLDRGGNLQAEYRRAGIWDARKGLIERAMRRVSPARWQRLLVLCGQLDQAIKGLDPQDPWVLVERVLVGMAASGRSR